VAERVLVVRHGETEWSLSGQHTSVTDLPLTEHGQAQARAVHEKLAMIDFALVLSSPLQRAHETARLAGFGEQVELCEDLAEWNYGDYEGLTTPQIRDEHDPDWNLWRDGCPGGETAEQIGARVDRVLTRAAGIEGDVLCFAHGHVLRVLAARWVAQEVAFGAHLALAAAAVGVLGYERDTPVIDRWSA
jgi:probable phosphoglycerate mutase